MNNIYVHTNSRRDFLKLTALAGSALLLSSLSTGCGSSLSGIKNGRTSAHLANIPEDIKSILLAAHRAPSGHNTQPWKFRYDDNCIMIYPDYSRKLPAVDPENRELYMSLGCALENLLIAAQSAGYKTETEYFPERSDSIKVQLLKAAADFNPLCNYIYRRQCTKKAFNGTPVSEDDINIIRSAGTFSTAYCLTLTDKEKMKRVSKLVKKGNSLQLNDEAFNKELKEWIRFSKSEAEEKRDGLACDCSGNPSIPRWLGNIILGMVVNEESLNKSCEEQLSSSSGAALFATKGNSREDWIEAGRAYERFSLMSESLNIRTAFINQPVESKELHPQLMETFSASGLFPQLLIRFGYAEKMPPSRRRDLRNVII